MSSSVCVAGDFTKHLAAGYDSISRDSTDSEAATDNVTRLVHVFTQAGHNISTDEASEILQAAAETSGESNPPELGRRGRERVGWGKFCVCCSELLARKHGQARLDTQTRKQQRSSHNRVKQRDSVSNTESDMYDVFLGGSCNPTSWRRDVVIPQLLREGITFYNPQVDEWYPELIEIEEKAKEAASRLLYVIDDQTRAVASMVEVADFIGSGRDVLVVVDDIMGESPAIGGDVLSRREVEDLNRGRAFVRTVTEAAGGSLVESNVHRAVSRLVDISRWGQESSEEEYTTASHRPAPLTTLLNNKLNLLEKVHTMYDTDRRGHLTVEEAEWALLALRCCRNSVQLIWNTCSDTSDWLLWKREGISLEAFCVLYSEVHSRSLSLKGREAGLGGGEGRGREGGGVLSTTAGYLSGGLQRILAGWLWSPASLPALPPSPPHPLPSPPCTTTHYDVYLGGSCGSTSWRRDEVIPVLRQHGVTFFDPQVPNWATSLLPVEQAARDQCSVLLFVIGGDTLSVSSMVEVAYHMGQVRRLVLAVSDIPRPSGDATGTTHLEGMKLSPRAVRDYNRGRAYLASIARKRRVPLYTSPVDAALCSVYLAKGYEIPTHSHVPLQGTSV